MGESKRRNDERAEPLLGKGLERSSSRDEKEIKLGFGDEISNNLREYIQALPEQDQEKTIEPLLAAIAKLRNILHQAERAATGDVGFFQSLPLTSFFYPITSKQVENALKSQSKVMEELKPRLQNYLDAKEAYSLTVQLKVKKALEDLAQLADKLQDDAVKNPIYPAEKDGMKDIADEVTRVTNETIRLNKSLVSPEPPKP